MNNTHPNTRKIKTLLALTQTNPQTFLKNLLTTYKSTSILNLEKIKVPSISNNNAKLRTAICQVGANGSYHTRLSKRSTFQFHDENQNFDSCACLSKRLTDEYSNSKLELSAHLKSLQI